MNRSKNFIGINAKLIMFLKNYKIEKKEILGKWTTDLLSDDQLLSLEQAEQLKDFVTSVFGICSEPHDMKQALIMDILVEKFKQTKRGQQHFKTVQRQRLLHLVIALIDSEENAFSSLMNAAGLLTRSF